MLYCVPQLPTRTSSLTSELGPVGFGLVSCYVCICVFLTRVSCIYQRVGYSVCLCVLFGCYFDLLVAAWLNGNALVSINVVALRRARLVLG